MKITDIIQSCTSKKEKVFSIEILPPLKGQKIEDVFSTIESLLEFDLKFVNVTYHRHDYIDIKDTKTGKLIRVPYKKRPGTISICSAIQNKFNIETIPHLICGGFTKEETEDALIDMRFLGINNVLALRGDAHKNDEKFIPTEGGHSYASQLMQQIRTMDKGQYLHHKEDKNELRNKFCVGVAAYPEKHFESKDLDEDFEYFKQKIEIGADFAVTQMFFDNQKFYDFVERCKQSNITIPILPGLKPIKTLKQVKILPEIFFCSFPEPLALELKKAKTNEQVRAIGVEWCIEQCKDMLRNGHNILHFYTMGKGEETKAIAKEVL